MPPSTGSIAVHPTASVALDPENVGSVGANDVSVRVHAIAVTPSDVGAIYDLSRFGGSSRVISGIGSGFSGEIVAVGPSVGRIKPGDSVFGLVLDPMTDLCGSDTISVPSSVCTLRPRKLSHAQAASLVADCMIAERCLRVVKACDTDSILITGGATPLAKAIIQVAKSSMFSIEWIATTTGCPEDREYSESIGADETFDTKSADGDWSRVFASGSNPKQYDIVIDIVGDSKQAKRLLRKGSGRLVSLYNKPTPSELLDYDRRVGGTFLKSSTMRYLLKSRIGNLVTGCSGRVAFSQGRYFSVLPSGDGEILERLAVLMDTEAVTPCVERVEDSGEAARVVEEVQSKPFGLRGRIVIQF